MVRKGGGVAANAHNGLSQPYFILFGSFFAIVAVIKHMGSHLQLRPNEAYVHHRQHFVDHHDVNVELDRCSSVTAQTVTEVH